MENCGQINKYWNITQTEVDALAELLMESLDVFNCYITFKGNIVKLSLFFNEPQAINTNSHILIREDGYDTIEEHEPEPVDNILWSLALQIYAEHTRKLSYVISDEKEVGHFV